MLNQEEIKLHLGREAAKLVETGMTVGIGSGSTASAFIKALSERVKEGLDIKGVPTSSRTEKLAREHNIPLIELNEAKIDLAIDGADEITRQLQVIKGGGGALLQEKMVADASARFVVIADDTKLKDHLGTIALPVEVIPYGWKQVRRRLISMGCEKAELRMRDEKIFVTDHGHYILDCYFGNIPYPATLHSKLNNLPGVVENGLFLNMVDTAIIGHADGTATWLEREST